MKRRLLIIMLVFMLSISMVACGGENETTVKQDDVKESVTANGQEEENNTQEKEETKQEPKEQVKEEQNESNSEGINLINSMGTDRPDTLRIVSEITAFNMTTTMTTYYDGDKSKTEIDVPNMSKSILIHIPNKEIMYQYVYGESTGIKITGADKASAEEMGLMMDTSLLTALQDGASDDIIARTEYLEELDSEEVIYIETTESDEDMGEMLVKMWYSEKYATPLKYEVYVGEKLMTELNVTKINDNVNFNADTFMPPSDVTFQEVDMEAMMDMY